MFLTPRVAVVTGGRQTVGSPDGPLGPGNWPPGAIGVVPALLGGQTPPEPGKPPATGLERSCRTRPRCVETRNWH